METILDNLATPIILPLFAILLSGYLAARFKLLPDTASHVLSRFVFVIALPALIFSSLSRISVAEFFNWQYIGALGGGMLIMFCLGMLVARIAFPGRPATLACHAGLARLDRHVFEYRLYRAATDPHPVWR